ncbi:MAG TPA: peptidase M16, partial [Verrucomicrobiales bacterium]|nr:peptidase M16 [Verrucomicrobiales bacterium]
MKFIIHSLIGTLAIAAPLHAKTTPATWAHEISDIQPDANVRYGKLANGMKYIIMQNAEPPGRVSMRLHIAAGSLMERDDQRGVAHFLEHMVFNGSKNFPDSTKLIPQMQRLGIAFGAHANAYTSFDETVYMLDLPNNKADTLKLGFDVMRDFGDGAFLRKEEIDKERGVILAEKTSRDSVQMRLMEQQFNALLPDALLVKRFPIGTEEIIKSAPRSAFTDFYSQYYIPSRMTFLTGMREFLICTVDSLNRT